MMMARKSQVYSVELSPIHLESSGVDLGSSDQKIDASILDLGEGRGEERLEWEIPVLRRTDSIMRRSGDVPVTGSIGKRVTLASSSSEQKSMHQHHQEHHQPQPLYHQQELYRHPHPLHHHKKQDNHMRSQEFDVDGTEFVPAYLPRKNRKQSDTNSPT